MIIQFSTVIWSIFHNSFTPTAEKIASMRGLSFWFHQNIFSRLLTTSVFPQSDNRSNFTSQQSLAAPHLFCGQGF